MEKRLYRSRKDTFLSGVCGGIADYFGFDVSLVRIGWVIATLATGGLGFIAYIIAAVVVPLEPMGGMGSMNTEYQSSSEAKASEPKAEEKAESSYGSHYNTYSGDCGEWRREGRPTRRYAGLFLILLGMFFIAKRYIPSLDFGMLWAVCLVVVGAALMTKRR